MYILVKMQMQTTPHMHVPNLTLNPIYLSLIHDLLQTHSPDFVSKQKLKIICFIFVVQSHDVALKYSDVSLTLHRMKNWPVT